MNNKMFFIIGNIIVFMALVVISFLFSEQYTTIFWCSLFFTLIAFIVETAINLSNFGNKNIENYFFGLPLTYHSMIYVIIQSIAGLIFSLLYNLEFKIGFIIQFLILAICAVILISAYMGKNSLSEKDADKSNSKSYMLYASAILSTIEQTTQDRELKLKIHSIFEAAKMSNPLVNPQLAEVEGKIANQISQLKENVNNKEAAEKIITEIKNLINERNNFCKIINR